ncbi:hypothetical protein ACSU6B_00880 [Neobacillus sp. C211]|uniref:Uncharacterized protein n=1 Tax=Priestia megaterium TaxID=1404 RepID=A0A6H1P143_PRIMG|nr:hypothetical protein [Priestia megaterium]QIZ07185.1 hypothetical protein HFZ78_11070 [Priestia megaterium]
MDIKKLIKKAENIWFHYKSFILLGIVIAGMILSLLPSFHHSRERALQAVFIGNYVKGEKQLELQTTTKKILGKTNSDSAISMDFWATRDETLFSDSTFPKKLAAMIATESVDIVVMDKKSFLAFARQGTFLPLDPFESKFSKGVQFLSGMEKGQKHLYGIEIAKTKQLGMAGYHTKDKVLGIVTNSKNHKMAVQAVKTLVD